MSENKRYFWLKLNENFFEDDTIAWIEEQDNGKDYVIFYLKLCLKSLKEDGRLIRYVGEGLIPYDVKALAKLTNTPQDTVAVAMKVFLEIGLIERLDTGEIFMKQINEMIGGETEVAKRVRKHRAKNKAIEGKGIGLLQGNGEVTKSNTEIEIELELDKEIDKENNIKQNPNVSNSANAKYADDSPFLKLAILLFERIKTRNPKHKKPNLQSWAEDVRKTIELDDRTNDEYLQVLEWSQRDLFWQTNILSPAKLRKQFDTLTLQMQSDLNKRNGFKPTVVPQQTKIHEHVISDADKEAFERLQREGF